MPVYDFDFQRYVERRKGARAAERREGAAYGFAADLRIRRVLDRLRPVTLALETTVKLWNASARAELLGTTVRITERSYPRVQRAADAAAARLHVVLPPLHASPHPGIAVSTLGTDDEPAVLLHAALCDALSDDELVFAIGAELGRIQNAGVLLGTAHYFLHRTPGGFLRWAAGPARAALDGWWRRAAVTADRAGLIACRDLAVAASAIRAIARAADGSSEEADGAAATPGPARETGPGAEGETAAAAIRARLAALEVFAQSAYYRGALGETGGFSPEETDRRAGEAIALAIKGSP